MQLLRLISTLFLALILVQGSVVEAVARSEMQAAPGFEICGQGHDATLGGMAGGKGHPCQHCLAAAATADLGGPLTLPQPELVRAEGLAQCHPVLHPRQHGRPPLARGPPLSV